MISVDGTADTLVYVPGRGIVLSERGIMDGGIALAGGGALLQGLGQRLRDECQMPCQLAESPLTFVAVGSGLSLEELEAIHRAGKKNSRARPVV